MNNESCNMIISNDLQFICYIKKYFIVKKRERN